MSNKINAAIQVLPKSSSKHPYELVDLAIGAIKNSGLPYEVTPFETVIEGTFEEVTRLIASIQESVFEAGGEEMMIYTKMQIRKDQDVDIEEKMGKYR